MATLSAVSNCCGLAGSVRSRSSRRERITESFPFHGQNNRMGEYITSDTGEYSWLIRSATGAYSNANRHFQIKNISYASSRDLVTSMDPDAPHREKRQLHDLDVVI